MRRTPELKVDGSHMSRWLEYEHASRTPTSPVDRRQGQDCAPMPPGPNRIILPNASKSLTYIVPWWTTTHVASFTMSEVFSLS